MRAWHPSYSAELPPSHHSCPEPSISFISSCKPPGIHSWNRLCSKPCLSAEQTHTHTHKQHSDNWTHTLLVNDVNIGTNKSWKKAPFFYFTMTIHEYHMTFCSGQLLKINANHILVMILSVCSQKWAVPPFHSDQLLCSPSLWRKSGKKRPTETQMSLFIVLHANPPLLSTWTTCLHATKGTPESLSPAYRFYVLISRRVTEVQRQTWKSFRFQRWLKPKRTKSIPLTCHQQYVPPSKTLNLNIILLCLSFP